MMGKPIVLSGVLAAFLTMGTLGCEEQKGPAESAGQKIDEKMQGAGEAMKDAGEKAKDAAEEAKH